MREFFGLLFFRLKSPLLFRMALTTAVLLGIAGPFGTFTSLSFPIRLGYWSGLVGISVFLSVVATILVGANIRFFYGFRRSLIVSGLLIIVLAPILSGMTHLVLGTQAVYQPPLWAFAVTIMLIALWVCFAKRLFRVREIQTRPRIFSRFDDPEAVDVTRMTVRDHYVEVYTNCGKETLLMRFSDALDEVDGIAGLRVHRSHWVAKCAVAKLKKVNGRTVVVLRNGAEVPVSRAYRQAARLNFG